MAKSKFDAFRAQKATELRQLANILNRKTLCDDISPLRSAAEQCASQMPKGKKSWVYDISNLIFRFENPPRIQPKETKNFRIELSVNIGGLFDDAENDQFTHLSIDFEKYVDNAEGEELKAAWHFDRHIGNTDNQKEIHPLYHFQYGGNKLEAYQDRLGSTFLLEAPRLMHPPMDGILAIDFVLSNYAGELWKELRADGEYFNLIDSALRAIWKPYFESIASNWASPKMKNCNLFCPHVWNG